MIAIHRINTKYYDNTSSMYYNMLDVAENSIFTVILDGKKIRLKCINQINGICIGCYFHDRKLCPSEDGYNTCGLSCNPKDREDGNNCIFVEIENKKKNGK